jgi:hypothetical protein
VKAVLKVRTGSKISRLLQKRNSYEFSSVAESTGMASPNGFVATGRRRNIRIWICPCP